MADEKPEGTIFIVPARLEECIVPNRLSDYHWVDLFEGIGYEKLMRALRSRANDIGATLQIKKSWLPKITSPTNKIEKTVYKELEENKTNEEEKRDGIEKKRSRAGRDGTVLSSRGTRRYAVSDSYTALPCRRKKSFINDFHDFQIE